jgi:hypothetical protein
MANVPKIRPLKWTSVRDVLPHEALHFTPWLASNLDLLANVLGLEELELVGTESSVDAFRLDIRATGTDVNIHPLWGGVSGLEDVCGWWCPGVSGDGVAECRHGVDAMFDRGG